MRLIISILLLFTSVCGISFWKLTYAEDSCALAENYMWDHFHRGDYDSIPKIIQMLDKAYAKDPDDIQTTSHLGFVHLWAFSERARKKVDSSIIEHVFLSNRYFKEAMLLNPEDARLKGFQSATDICEGALSLKLFMVMKGYFNGFRSINDWPQFNKFAVSLIGSQSRKNSIIYKLALKYQWDLIDDCSCRELSKRTIMQNPAQEFTKLFEELKGNKDPLISRACKNSWIAPHNLEGFFLNFGDMLVKDGQLKEAFEIYNAARLCPSYKTWPFASVLEERIKNMNSNKNEFNRPLKLITDTDNEQLFINSKMSCVACHQMGASEFISYKSIHGISVLNN
jgi:hypothetical protein